LAARGRASNERSDLVLRGRIGARVLHARYDPRLLTANARTAFLASFERAVDPDGRLPADERRRQATHPARCAIRALGPPQFAGPQGANATETQGLSRSRPICTNRWHSTAVPISGRRTAVVASARLREPSYVPARARGSERRNGCRLGGRRTGASAPPFLPLESCLPATLRPMGPH